MKRDKVAARLNKLADTIDFIADTVDQEGEGAGDDYRHAARMVRREAYRIKEKL